MRKSQLRRTPNFSIDNYYIALQNNEIVGTLAIWDTSLFNKIKIIKYGIVLRIVRYFYLIIAKLFRFNPLPKEGGHLRSMYIRDIGIKNRDPEIFKALFVNVYNKFRSQDFHVIYVGFVKGDPLQNSLSHFFYEIVESQLVLGVLDPVELATINVNNPLIEFGIL